MDLRETKKLFCALCQREVDFFLEENHIVPESLYKPVYDKSRTATATILKTGKARKVQKGFKTKFLCAPCERSFQPYDNYAALIFGLTNPRAKAFRDLRIEEHPLAFLYSGLDFRKTQKFVISVVLKGDAHRRHGNDGKILADKHFERLRGNYFDEEYDNDGEYPIIITATSKTDIDFATVMTPSRARFADGRNSVIFFASGFQFLLIATGHPLDEQIFNARLKRDGTALITKLPYKKSGAFRDLMKRTSRQLY